MLERRSCQEVLLLAELHLQSSTRSAITRCGRSTGSVVKGSPTPATANWFGLGKLSTRLPVCCSSSSKSSLCDPNTTLGGVCLDRGRNTSPRLSWSIAKEQFEGNFVQSSHSTAILEADNLRCSARDYKLHPRRDAATTKAQSSGRRSLKE
jgi:hypothetical protein